MKPEAEPATIARRWVEVIAVGFVWRLGGMAVDDVDADDYTREHKRG